MAVRAPNREEEEEKQDQHQDSDLCQEEIVEEECCPICLLPEPMMLITPCNHVACKNCLEKILLSTTRPRDNLNDGYNNDEAVEDSIIATCPTRGRCPFCRRCINMFDLKYKNGLDEDTRNPVYEQNIDLRETPLHDLEFSNSSSRNMILSFKDGKAEIVIKRDVINNKEVVRRHRFEDGYHYHAKSMTFSGIVDWTNGGKPWEGVDQWEFVAQFSSDCKYIRRGAIIKTCRNNDTEENKKKYPLDGQWQVQWIKRRVDLRDDVDFANGSRLTVTRNKFTIFGESYHICLGRGEADNDDDNENDITYFDWPSFGDGEGSKRQVVESGIDLRRVPHGPDVGSVVVWTVNHPDFHRILWKRETRNTIQPVQIEHLGRDGTMFYVEGGRSNSLSNNITYNSTSPWGNTFIQCTILGLASYHFVSAEGEGEDHVYISYENEQCSAWPPLDDGSPVPYRVPFINTSYDSETRTFRGKIPWMEVYGTSWQGNSEWNYEIIFDTRFTCVVGGSVSMIGGGDDGIDSNFGEDLNYCNVALVEMIRGEVDEELNSHSESLSSDESRNETNPGTLGVTRGTNEENNTYRNGGNNQGNSDHDNVISDSNSTNNNTTTVRVVIAGLFTRLHNEGVSPRTTAMMRRIANGAINPRLNPIDYLSDEFGNRQPGFYIRND